MITFAQLGEIAVSGPHDLVAGRGIVLAAEIAAEFRSEITWPLEVFSGAYHSFFLSERFKHLYLEI